MKLTGKDLATYLEGHKKEFNGNGDAFCLAAGYGMEDEDGSQKCNFTAFVEAVSTALDTSSMDNDIQY